jgi:hypothetical protein
MGAAAVALLAHAPLFQSQPPHLFGLVHGAGQVRPLTIAQQPLSAQPAGSGESGSWQPHVPQWHSFVAQKSVQHGSAEAEATAARAKVFIIELEKGKRGV